LPAITLGYRIKQLREKQNLSMKALARRLKVDPAHLSRIESDKIVPSESLSSKIADALKCGKEELLLLAGKLPKDVQEIIRANPYEACSALRYLHDNINNSYSVRPAGNGEDGNAKYRLMDLFCGAGGMTAGFVATNRFVPVFANDFDKWSIESYNTNFGAHTTLRDINDLLEDVSFSFPECDVVIGGPPCQGFSLLNKNRKNDPRKQLWRAFLEVVKRTHPAVFVMENVPGLIKSIEYDEIRKEAERFGYTIEGRVLNAADYGVPQRRKRAIVIGAKNGTYPVHPEPTHYDPNGGYGTLIGQLLPWETVKRAISDLPKPIGTEIRTDVESPLNLHFGRNPTDMSVERYKCIPEGGNRFDLQKKRPDLTPECWIKKTQGGTDLFGRLWWDKPAFTIRTEFFKPEKGRYLHPEQNRPITHREAARLQTFPDSFRFEGTKIEIAKQIGNAVPVLLAQRIAEKVVSLIDRAVTPVSSDNQRIVSHG